jgi:hypothetical protein
MSWFYVSYVKLIICSQFRSKSCPQCRNRTTEWTIHQVYFNVASNDLEEDTSVLRNEIDNLKLQIHLKNTDIKNSTEENHTLNSQNEGLRLVINATCIFTTDVEETNL